MVAAAIAAVPLASEAVRAATDFARDVLAQVFDMVRQPLLSGERVVRRGAVTTTTKAAVPAWVVIAIPIGLWLLGIGVGFKEGKATWTERPRMTLPFAPQAGGQAAAGFIPDWIPILDRK